MLFINKDVNLTLLQKRSTPIENGLPSPATVLFNRLISGLLPKINKTPVIYDYDDEHYNVLKKR